MHIALDGNLSTSSGTASAVAGAATINAKAGIVTSEALTTAAGAAYTLTLTNSSIAPADIVFVSVTNGTNAQGDPDAATVTPGNGVLVIRIVNRHATQALNGTLKIAFLAIKP